MTLHLFRAVAYRMEPANLPLEDSQPEVTVFFEATSAAVAPAQLKRALHAVWDCPANEVDFYNLWTEAEMLANSTCALDPTAGEAWLFETGWGGAPLFSAQARTLMLVRPSTLVRLVVARTAVAGVQQFYLAQAQARAARSQRNVACRAEYQALQSMGGFC